MFALYTTLAGFVGFEVSIRMSYAASQLACDTTAHISVRSNENVTVHTIDQIDGHVAALV